MTPRPVRRGVARRWTVRQAVGLSVALGLIVFGVGLMALPTLEGWVGQWGQHQAAVENDLSKSRFALAMEDAYGEVSSDFESSIVSFEVGALPTTTDGRIIGLAGPQPAVASANAEPAGRFEPPPAFEGVTIRIPSIGLDQTVVEGVGRDHLQVGPGHYPGTAQPGYGGNVVISGHRTTFTRPFFDVDLLDSGDSIFLDTPRGTYRYVVQTTYVVDPTDLSPLVDTGAPVLTLTTCTPKGSADRRLIVVADLDGVPEELRS